MPQKTATKKSSKKPVKKKQTVSISHLQGGRYFKGVLRQAILQRDNFQCVLCGAKAADGNVLEVDHIIEAEDGGRTTYENGQTVCQQCNKGKSELKRHSQIWITPNQFSKIVQVHRNKVADAVQKGIIDIDSKTKKINKETELKKWKEYYDIDRTVKQITDTAIEYSIPPEVLQKHIYSFGRPSEYREEMCNELIHHMMQGRSFSNAAALMGISYTIAYDWVKEVDADGNPNPRFKPDFLKAYKIGLELSELWWDEIGRTNLGNKDFNNSLYMMFRTNKHGWTRRLEGKVDVVETNHTIDEKRITINQIQQIGDEGLAEIARILIDAGAIKPAVQATAYAQGQ